MIHKQILGALLTIAVLTPGLGWALDVEKATVHAQNYVAAFKNSDWEKVSKLLHPSAPKEIRGSITEALLGEQTRGANRLRSYLFGYLPSVKPVLSMTDEQFFAAVMRNVVGRNYGGTLKLEKLELLGLVVEGEELIHFVARMQVQAGGRKLNVVSAETLLANDQGYGMLLNAQLQGAIDRIVLFLTSRR